MHEWISLKMYNSKWRCEKGSCLVDIENKMRAKHLRWFAYMHIKSEKCTN